MRASGPGGQNVNKVATAVELRFDVRGSSLPSAVKQSLAAIAGTRLTADGVLLIDSREHRTQTKNRDAARARLVALLKKAAIKPRKRRPTKPRHRPSFRARAWLSPGLVFRSQIDLERPRRCRLPTIRRPLSLRTDLTRLSRMISTLVCLRTAIRTAGAAFGSCASRTPAPCLFVFRYSRRQALCNVLFQVGPRR